MAAINDSVHHSDQDASLDKTGLLSRAWRLRAQGQFPAAADYCQQALRRDPQSDEGWHLLGLIKWDLAERPSAIACLKRAIGINPLQHLHHNTIGVMLIETGDYVSATTSLNEALRIAPDYHDSRSNLGLALFHQHRLEQARQCFETVLGANPGHSEAAANLGMIHLTSGNLELAVQAYEKALTAEPGHSRWLGNLGAAFLARARFAEAARCFKAALCADPDHPMHGVNLAIALRAMGNWSDSIVVLERVLGASSGYGPALANLAIAYQQACQWSKLEPLYRQLDQLLQSAIEKGMLPDEQPLMNIRRCSDPAVNLSVARAWSLDTERRALKIAGRCRHRRMANSNDRITVGYLSYDFRDHPVSHQLAPLFRLHDRRRFCVKAFSMGPDDGSVFRRDIERNSDCFIDIGKDGLRQAAGMMVGQKVDILVDLMGHTHHNRMEILALRPAPLQVGYLGFLGSSGADFMDYVIADDLVVPEAHRQFYSEKIIGMPHCYQINHRLWHQDGMPGPRGRYHLPENGFVFCCFNQAYKIDRDLFASWLRILSQVPQAVLWLYRDHPMVVSRLQGMAADWGLDPGRIIFADQLPLRQHLDRLRSADLALDTIGYNGGATTANCLGAGVPVLAVLGAHWVSRMSASHLCAAGVPELVARDPGAYEEKAIDLALRPEKLDAIRKRLRQAHASAALFRPDEFVRDLESALETIWKRHLSGQAPADIRLKPAEGRIATADPIQVEK